MKRASLVFLTIVLLTVILLPLGTARGAKQGGGEFGTTTRVSVASDGAQSVDEAVQAYISANGRFVAFVSLADNLVPGDTNGFSDAFVHDRFTGQTTRISVANDGSQSNEASSSPVLSADGRYVMYTSTATNLVPGDTNGFNDIFVYDRDTGINTLVSVATNGSQANSHSGAVYMSANGRRVAFESAATNLVSGDTNGVTDIFLRDLDSQTTTRVNVSSDGTQATLVSSWPSISGDGSTVAFHTASPNLVLSDTNGVPDIFIHDVASGVTTRASVAADGTQGNGSSQWSALSHDGRYVVFESLATNLISGDTNGARDVYVHDNVAGLSIRVSVASDGTQGNLLSAFPAISADGNATSFDSSANNLVSGDTNNTRDVFVHFLDTGITERVSVATDGSEANNRSNASRLSHDGRNVSFDSIATNLVMSDTNGLRDVFVNDRSPTLTPTPVPSTATPTLTPTVTLTPTSTTHLLYLPLVQQEASNGR